MPLSTIRSVEADEPITDRNDRSPPAASIERCPRASSAYSACGSKLCRRMSFVHEGRISSIGSLSKWSVLSTSMPPSFSRRDWLTDQPSG